MAQQSHYENPFQHFSQDYGSNAETPLGGAALQYFRQNKTIIILGHYCAQYCKVIKHIGSHTANYIA
jgi:hypothetical protein